MNLRVVDVLRREDPCGTLSVCGTAAICRGCSCLQEEGEGKSIWRLRLEEKQIYSLRYFEGRDNHSLSRQSGRDLSIY